MVNDLTGQRFGKLVAIERASIRSPNRSAYWRCQCDCGNEKITSSTCLRKGKTRSCGCIKSSDLTGERFGKLVCIRLTENPGKKSAGRYWECQCDCGNIVVVARSGLINGTKSCGCIHVSSDLTGRRFGSVVVIKSHTRKHKNGKNYHLCRCDCGVEKEIIDSSLLKIKSCGCKRKKDIIGQRFGKLVVIGIGDKVGNSGETYRWCRCDCGNTGQYETKNLTRGATTSCGCLMKPDKSGQWFGRIEVLRRVRKDKFKCWVYLCRCYCGKEFECNSSRLDKVKSCGCSRCLDLVGKRFGSLVAVSRFIRDNVGWHICKCDCGNEKGFRSSSLRLGVKSCGCGNRLSQGVANLFNIWRKESWPYGTVGKQDITDMLMSEVDSAGMGDLKFLSLPGNGREIKLFDSEFCIDYESSLGVEKYHSKDLRKFFRTLFAKKELSGILPIQHGDIDDVIMKMDSSSSGFNLTHLDYNGVLTPNHVLATEKSLKLSEGGIVAVTVSQRPRRAKGWIDYQYGQFPFYGLLDKDVDMLFWQEYKGKRGRPMETYAFRLKYSPMRHYEKVFSCGG